MIKQHNLLLGLVCSLALCSPVHAEPLRYIKEQKGEQQVMLWEQVPLEDQWLIRAQEDDRQFRNVVLNNGETVHWAIESESVQLEAEINEGALLLQGTRDDKVIEEQQDLQGLPWYQPLSYSLARFLETSVDKTEFWMVRPDNFKLIKMQAVKKGSDVLQGEKGAIYVERVSVRPVGLLAMMWQADYWFAAEDRQFLKYESSGAMGIAETTVQLDSLVN